MSADGSQKLRGDLERFVASRWGARGALDRLEVMEDGHAGLTFGFDVARGDKRPERLILKLAPAGVRRSGNTDVFRQAPLLEGLFTAGIPVPRLRFAAPDEAEFGVPYIVTERLPGRTFVVWDPHPSFSRDPAAVAPLWRAAAAALARIHAVDWRRHLAGWEAPRPLADELGRWAPLLRHALEPRWAELGRRLGERLTATLPEEGPPAVVHGDYQPGNILFERDGALVSILDWELSLIGDPLLDLGWLMMMSDGASWHETWQPVAPLAAGEVAELYREAGGRRGDERWYRALAGYRLGVISCLNVKLHRTGKRVDPIWERFALSIPALFERGLELLGGGKA
jgi:aminoglycoside phosphotransferase (APT) family kinase protein